jgi:hypothetical protein
MTTDPRQLANLLSVVGIDDSDYLMHLTRWLRAATLV